MASADEISDGIDQGRKACQANDLPFSDLWYQAQSKRPGIAALP